MNTIFTVFHVGTFNTSIQAMSLIFQVQTARQSLSDRFYRALYDSLIDRRLYTCSKHAMFLNLLHRSLKSDVSLNRVRAFVKRLVQTCTMATPPFICASLFLIGDVAKAKPGIWGMITQPEEDDFEEKFFDAPDEDEDSEKGGDDAERKAAADKPRQGDDKKYDPRNRNPLYCRAELSCLWELLQFTQHFHPTVALYASTLLEGRPIVAPPNTKAYDPLQNHTLARFLDRFVYKNPKKVASAYKGSSVMQARPPGIGAGYGELDEEDGRSKLIAGGRKRGVIVEDEEEGRVFLDDDPVNSAVFLNKGRNNVPVDERFYFDFFSDKRARETKSGKSKRKKDKDEDAADVVPAEDGEGVDEDEEELGEDEVWQAMQKSAKADEGFDIEDDGGDDDDEDDFDMDQAMLEAGDDDSDEEVFEQDNEDGEGGDDDDENLDADDLHVPKTLNVDRVGEADEDGLIGEDADEELAGMFMGEGEDSDMDDDDDDGVGKKKGGKPTVGKAKASKIKKLADVAEKLGYKGEYFKAKLRGPREDDGFAAAGGIGGGDFASLDDFVDLIENDGGDDDGGREARINTATKGKVAGKPLSGNKAMPLPQSGTKAKASGKRPAGGVSGGQGANKKAKRQ
ncbi:hypothetical protein HDU76_013126 [Blyttiomyces sp. JEL0837]|nr:hypothetical protein HDU76_013126 [Blyttiomyces sp. JEL0837]